METSIGSLPQHALSGLMAKGFSSQVHLQSGAGATSCENPCSYFDRFTQSLWYSVGDDRMRESAGKVYGLGKIEYLQCGTVREQYGFYYDFLVSIGTPVN